jgi:hypothetical protein
MASSTCNCPGQCDGSCQRNDQFNDGDILCSKDEFLLIPPPHGRTERWVYTIVGFLAVVLVQWLVGAMFFVGRMSNDVYQFDSFGHFIGAGFWIALAVAEMYWRRDCFCKNQISYRRWKDLMLWLTIFIVVELFAIPCAVFFIYSENSIIIACLLSLVLGAWVAYEFSRVSLVSSLFLGVTLFAYTMILFSGFKDAALSY